MDIDKARNVRKMKKVNCNRNLTNGRNGFMKRKIGWLLTWVMVLICAFALADVKINEENFPDEAFRNVTTLFDKDGNGKLSDKEIAAVTAILCDNKGITSMKGIEHFTALEILYCYSNRLTSLDVSKNKALKELWCQKNQLTELDVRKNTKLIWLSCESNQIKKLDISRIPVLKKVAKNKPTAHGSWLEWEINESNGYPEYYLSADKTVKLITKKTAAVSISKAKAAAIADQVYTGEAIKPAVTVKYNGKKLTKGTDYTVTYKNNKKIGTATVTITGKDDYKGTQKVTFRIVPKAAKFSSITAGEKQLTVQWGQGSNITGYQIEYSLKKDFSDSKNVTISKAATTKKVIGNLESGKKYFIRIRTYKTVNGKKYWSAWSAVKYKTTK